VKVIRSREVARYSAEMLRASVDVVTGGRDGRHGALLERRG